MPITTHRRACHLCEAICGLVIETDGDEIRRIKGDPQDPLSRGHICPKAVALQDIHTDPDRLRRPLRRISARGEEPRFEEIDWETALTLAADGLADTVSRHGVDSLGVYLGNPTVHNLGMMTHQGALFRLLRTRNRFSATSVDQLPHHLAALWLFGHKFLLPIPDIDRSQYFLMLGANPIASNGSLWSVPDVRRRIRDLQSRGGRLVVIDPRRTETAAIADRHHFIHPGSDALFLAALLHTLLREERTGPRALEALTEGLEAVSEAVADFSPEAVAPHTGIPAQALREIAREFAAAEAAICYGRMGVSTTHFGALNQWLIQVINIVTGNLDRAGGSLFSSPAVDQVTATGPGGFARSHSRVRGLPEFDRELPVAALAEEITTPGEGRIRALFVGAGNPVLSTPNGRQLDQALEQLDWMVCLDPYLNETTCHADLILPPCSPLESGHYDLAFHLNAVRNTARYSPPVFPKPAGSLYDWEIFNALGEKVAGRLGQDWQAWPPPEDLVDQGLRHGPYGAAQGHPLGLDLATLREHPSGLDLGPLQSQLPGRLRTPDQRIHLDHPLPLQDLERLRQELQAPRESGLRLIGRRHIRSNNSWMHNYHRLIKGRDRCTLLMHPQDMRHLHIGDGQDVRVSSRVGSLTVPAEASEDMMPGVVSLPHGYGHGRRGVQLGIAQQHAGVSCNDLTDDHWLDALSGNAALNGVAVSVAPVTDSPSIPGPLVGME
ncbi:MAG: dehydrogenase [Haliea sp.]|nr:dehydrogenase [Haliea sp.]|tara:strand:+ start:15696 stop:17861 length:2166 start_codon:yes stop_codon:yes gene_type:complete